MDLEYLNGVPDTNNRTGDAQDFMGLMGEQEALSELGKLFKRKAASGGGGGAPKKGGLFKRNSGGNTEGGTKKKGAKIKNFLKKGLHITNRLNPAAATLRAGILAAMKLNFMKIGGQIRYSYLTEEQAQQKGLIMDRYRKMKTVREKLEKIFYGAGGKPENLKKAILKGHGNKNKEVPLTGLGYTYENIDGLNEDMPLSQLLGREMYLSESMDGIEGLGALGEPATAATIAAATTVLTTIAALIKKVGSLVPNKKAAGGESGGGGDSDGGDSGGGDSGGDSGSGVDSGGGGDSSSGDSSSSDSGSSDSGSGSGDSSDGGSDEGTNGSASKPAAKNSGSGGGGSSDDGGGDDDGDSGESGNANKSAAKSSGSSTKSKPSFWENNKKWIKPVGIGVGSLGLIALFWHLFKPKPQPKAALNGLPAKKRKPKKQSLLSGLKSKPRKGGNHQRKKKTKKKVVTLL